ncbi:MAG: hypothetical protein K2N01_00925 [Lachnospiraceae bacterium]|nr:hypothetical protein [Lachnospiraceae bacterium]
MKEHERIWKYAAAFAALAVGAFLFRLGIVGCLICTAVFAVVAFRWKSVMEEEQRQKIRLQEVQLYLEQLLYSFLQHQKILSALEDVCPLFPEGNMRRCLDRAIAHIRQDYDSNAQEQLALLAEEYDNERLKNIHAYLLQVEQHGGAYESTVDFLLEDLRRWSERIRVYQEDCKRYMRNVLVAVCLSVLVCAITNSLLPGDLSIGRTVACQASGTVVLCLDMLLLLRTSKRTCRNWLKEKEYGSGDSRKQYVYCREHRNLKSMLYRRSLRKKMMRAFPQWLMDISLLLQTENVQVALYRTRTNAPEILRPAIEEMIEELQQNPESLEPYLNFLKGYDLPDVTAAMRMLYALSDGGYGSGEKQLAQILARNQELLDKAERARNEDALAGLYGLFLAPALTGAGKMMVDMTMFLILFLGQVQW